MVGILPWRFIPWLSFGSLFCHSQGRKRSFWCKGRFCLARGILKPLCAKEVHQCIFVHCTFKVYDQEVYVFPKKEMRKGPRRASLTVANYIFYGTFHIFALCFFFLCSKLHFPIKVILDGIESSPWALCAQFKGHWESWLSRADSICCKMFYFSVARYHLIEAFIPLHNCSITLGAIRASVISILGTQIRASHRLTACRRSHILHCRSQV